jgi:hypothetical protein
MTRQALEIVDLVQTCLQAIILLAWFVRKSSNRKFTLAAGLPVFVVFWGAPLAFLVVALVGVRHDFRVGLGETVSTWFSGAAMVRPI